MENTIVITSTVYVSVDKTFFRKVSLFLIS